MRRLLLAAALVFAVAHVAMLGTIIWQLDDLKRDAHSIDMQTWSLERYACEAKERATHARLNC